jgi:hypothetical protein
MIPIDSFCGQLIEKDPLNGSKIHQDLVASNHSNMSIMLYIFHRMIEEEEC